MSYRKQHKEHHQYKFYWTESRIIKNALAKGWHVFVTKMGKRHLIKHKEKNSCIELSAKTIKGRIKEVYEQDKSSAVLALANAPFCYRAIDHQIFSKQEGTRHD